MPDIRAPATTGNPDGLPPGDDLQTASCPRCGESFGNLGKHIVACGGGDDA
jgi:hypothetical protein